MKLTKIIIFTSTIFVVFGIFCIYVYVGTYIFPIAPHWVTQLPPNPPKPVIQYGEFKFKMSYTIDGINKEVSDVIECNFNGFEVRSVGDPKKRVWSENLKNINGYELFRFRDEKKKGRTYSAICVENIDKYKVILDIAKAEWFLGEPDYIGVPDMPNIQIYDTETRYYLDPVQRDEFLKKQKFEVVEWVCDNAVKNVFN